MKKIDEKNFVSVIYTPERDYNISMHLNLAYDNPDYVYTEGGPRIDSPPILYLFTYRHTYTSFRYTSNLEWKQGVVYGMSLGYTTMVNVP